MNEPLITFVAIAGSMLHAIAYVIYVRSALLDEVQPNPTSWLMWTYGTLFIIVIEWDQEATLAIMLLPMVCASCSLLVALLCWRRGRLKWPELPGDRSAFVLDLAFTALYVLLIVLDHLGFISRSDEVWLKSMLLILVSASTFVSFWPILRSTRSDPQNEHWLAWAIWTIAYAFLLIVTIATHGTSLNAIQFWAYPLSCLVLSGAVGFYACQDEPALAV